jgi:hypothetical protein
MSTQRKDVQEKAAQVARSLLRAVGGIVGRMTVFVWLSIVTFLVIFLLSETLSQQQAAELNAVFYLSVAGVEVSIFGVFATVTALWVISPYLLRVVDL